MPCDVPFRIAILDDSPVETMLEERAVAERFPGAEITVCNDPRLVLGHDVYLLDNKFGDTECAEDLARKIRAKEPDALIIVWSATVTKKLLKRLSPIGINAVAEKGNQDDVDAALEVIERFVCRDRGGRSFGETIRSIRDLLAEWNARLAVEEKTATA